MELQGWWGFQPTKNKSSVRKIQIDWMIISQFSALVKDHPKDKSIFIKEKIFNRHYKYQYQFIDKNGNI